MPNLLPVAIARSPLSIAAEATVLTAITLKELTQRIQTLLGL